MESGKCGREEAGEEGEDSRGGAEPQSEEEEEGMVKMSTEGTENTEDISHGEMGNTGEYGEIMPEGGYRALGQRLAGAAGRVGLEEEVVVMGAARKIGVERRVKLLEVLREVEEGVLVSASKEKPVTNVVGALRIAVDLDGAESMGDRVDVRRVAVHMAVEAIRIAGELGEREKGRE